MPRLRDPRRFTSLFLQVSAFFLAIPYLTGCQHGDRLFPDEAILPVTLPFEMPQPVRPVIPSARFDIRDFGARGGRIYKNTRAIQRAVDSAARMGGGSVVIPPGEWLTGAIHLESNINLHLDRGAELLFSQDTADYLPAVFSRHEDIECYKYSAFIYADGKRNIAITGGGVLNGQGKPWWTYKDRRKDSEVLLYEMAADGVPVTDRVFDGRSGRALRPAFFQPMHCTNVLVEGVTFLYGAFWTITPTYCDNVIIRKVHVVTDGPYGHTPNGDGVDPSSSTNVLIEDCDFDTGDDCIALKAGRDADGLRVNAPTRNVVIRNCRGLRGHGGIVVGSETSGGISNVFAYDCSFNGTDRIVRVKSARGRGGLLENMWFSHLSADTIQMEALRINMLYAGERYPAGEVGTTTPRIRNIHFEDISCACGRGYAIQVIGLPEMPAKQVTFTRIAIGAARGVDCVDVTDLFFHDVRVTPAAWPVYRFTDADSVVLDSVTVPAGADPFLIVADSASHDLTMRGTATASATTLVSLEGNARPGAVRIEH